MGQSRLSYRSGDVFVLLFLCDFVDVGASLIDFIKDREFLLRYAPGSTCPTLKPYFQILHIRIYYFDNL